MASTALSAQGTSLKLGTTAAAKNITAATKANPVKLTSTAHGLTDGTPVLIASVTGMTELNGKVGTVKVVDANNFELPGIDSTNFTTYTSGGTATPTQVTVGNLTNYSGFDGQAGETDVTNFASTSKEFITGLQDNGNVNINFHPDDTDQGQMALWSLRANTGAKATFVLTLRNSKTRTFQAACRSFTESAAVDGAVTGTAALRISGDVTKG